jgi:hypothetical protein
VYGLILAGLSQTAEAHIAFATGNIDDIPNPTEQNYFFKLRDADPTAMVAFDVVNPATTNTWNVDRYACSASADGLTQVGGRDQRNVLARHTGKALFDPVISNGTLAFTTYAPATNPCVAGESFLYALRLESCNDGLKSSSFEPDPYSGRIGLGPNLATAPVINEKKRKVVVTLDPGKANAPAGVVGKPTQVSLIKFGGGR